MSGAMVIGDESQYWNGHASKIVNLEQQVMTPRQHRRKNQNTSAYAQEIRIKSKVSSHQY